MRAALTFLLLAAAPAAAAEPPPPGASSCAGCHGRGAEAPFPIDHMTAEEIAAALAAFRSGAREGTLMNRIATGFSEAESAAIADWFGRRR